MTKSRKVTGLAKAGYQLNDYFLVGPIRWVLNEGGNFMVAGGHKAAHRAVWDAVPGSVSPCAKGWHNSLYGVVRTSPRAVVLTVIRKVLTERVRETYEVAHRLKRCRHDQMRLRNFLKNNPLK